METAIRVEDLDFKYDETQPEWTLHDVSFAIEKDEWVAIIGHNGSGKSTLSRLIDGLLEPTSGTITVNGEILTEAMLWDIRERIGLVFQNPDNQFVGATVVDDVAFALENAGIPHDEMIMRVEAALKEVGMWEYREKEPSALSGGQKQRVALAGVVALGPDIIILDEATSMLDPKGREEVIAVIQALKARQPLTVISITHDIEETTLADRVLVMKQGRLIAEGAPADIFAAGEQLVSIGLDVPFAERIRKALAARGVTVPNDYLDQEGLVNWLCQSVSNQ